MRINTWIAILMIALADSAIAVSCFEKFSGKLPVLVIDEVTAAETGDWVIDPDPLGENKLLVSVSGEWLPVLPHGMIVRLRDRETASLTGQKNGIVIPSEQWLTNGLTAWVKLEDMEGRKSEVIYSQQIRFKFTDTECTRIEGGSTDSDLQLVFNVSWRGIDIDGDWARAERAIIDRQSVDNHFMEVLSQAHCFVDREVKWTSEAIEEAQRVRTYFDSLRRRVIQLENHERYTELVGVFNEAVRECAATMIHAWRDVLSDQYIPALQNPEILIIK